MSNSSDQRSDAGSPDDEEEETFDAKIERLASEIEELKASLIGVPELSGEWFRIKTDIKDRDVERLLLLEEKRCNGVVKEYFEENPHVLEAVPECPVCLEKMWASSASLRYVCCGKRICEKCDSRGGDAFGSSCPLCRGKAPESADETLSIKKEKADSGIAWAQADMGNEYLNGYMYDGVPKEVEKGLSLLREAAEKDSTEAKTQLGQYYYEIGNYEEARKWHEAAAAEGEIISLFQLGVMMQNGQAFDQNEQTRAEAFRLFTLSATLLQDSFIPSGEELSLFFLESPPLMIHYLRPAVEDGNTSAEVIGNFALGLTYAAESYYGPYFAFVPGQSPVPEALFWFRQYSRKEEPDADHPLVRLERIIRVKCGHCRADLPEGKPSCCVECKAAYYCNRDCQVAHWKAGHKKDCVRKLKKRLKAAGTPFVEP